MPKNRIISERGGVDETERADLHAQSREAARDRPEDRLVAAARDRVPLFTRQMRRRREPPVYRRDADARRFRREAPAAHTRFIKDRRFMLQLLLPGRLTGPHLDAAGKRRFRELVEIDLFPGVNIFKNRPCFDDLGRDGFYIF